MTERVYGSFVKIDGNNMEIHNKKLQGYYTQEPALESCFIFNEGSHYLRTSLVKDIIPNDNGFVIKTMNSTYSFKKDM